MSDLIVVSGATVPRSSPLFVGTVNGHAVTYDAGFFTLEDGTVFEFRAFIDYVRSGIVRFASPELEAWYAHGVAAWTLTLDQRRERLAGRSPHTRDHQHLHVGSVATRLDPRRTRGRREAQDPLGGRVRSGE